MTPIEQGEDQNDLRLYGWALDITATLPSHISLTDFLFLPLEEAEWRVTYDTKAVQRQPAERYEVDLGIDLDEDTVDPELWELTGQEEVPLLPKPRRPLLPRKVLRIALPLSLVSFLAIAVAGGYLIRRSASAHEPEPAEGLQPSIDTQGLLYPHKPDVLAAQAYADTMTTFELRPPPEAGVSTNPLPLSPGFSGMITIRTETFGGRTFDSGDYVDIYRWGWLIKEEVDKTTVGARLRAAGLNPYDVVAAGIWVESKGNPLAIGQDGDTGLMQVVCGEHFADRPSQQALLDPRTNITTWFQIFLQDLAEHDGDVWQALTDIGPQNNGGDYPTLVISLAHAIEGK